ncbi:MAG: response regulator transcription factor [Solirubrobacteraceae bacterium]|nr:response regulator transcription factor [Solirubrobacteraceae bacterium]
MATVEVALADPAARAFITDNLAADGYDVQPADDAAADIVIVDARDPTTVQRLDSLDQGAAIVLRPLGWQKPIPLTLATEIIDVPFAYPDLRKRVGALLLRGGTKSDDGRLRVGELEVDPTSREVRIRGDLVSLSQKEFALLRALAAEPTRVHTKDQLLMAVWAQRGTTRTLDVHACRLRQKLSVHGDRFVVNVWGVGYRLVDGSAGFAPASSSD